MTTVPFTGLRCDRVGCDLRLTGRTETREELRRLTARAEWLGWQCLHVDGQPLHFCPDHVEPLLPTRRKL